MLAASSAALAPRVKIAVTDLRSVQGVAPGTATILTDIVVSEVARAGYDVVSQADITAMIGFEKQKRVLGCSEDSSCLAEIGGALGVDFMLTGQVGQIGTRNRVSLLVVDTKKARVVGRSAQFSRPERGRPRPGRRVGAEGDPRRHPRRPDGGAGAAAGTAAAAAKGTPPPTVAPGKAKPPPARRAGREDRSGPRRGTAAEKPATAQVAAPAVRPAGPRVAPRTSRWAAAARSSSRRGARPERPLEVPALDEKQGEFGYYDTYRAEKGAIRTRALAADALMVTGTAVAGVGGWLWWRAGRSHVAVVPTAGDGSVGLVASGSF